MCFSENHIVEEKIDMYHDVHGDTLKCMNRLDNGQKHPFVAVRTCSPNNS